MDEIKFETIVENEVLISGEFPKRVIPLIKEAKRTIDIIVFDWGWYPNEIGEQIQLFNNAIFRANESGVKVRAIVQRRKIQEILKSLNIESMILHSNKLLHIKMMIIDGKIGILGSHNYTKNAFNLNHEVSIVVKDKPTIDRMEGYFHNLYI